MEARIKILDYMKAAAILFVIINHSLPDALRFSLLFVYVVRMAVPLFVLVSGYTFAKSIGKFENPCIWWKWEYMYPKMVRFMIPVLGLYGLFVVKKYYFSGGVLPFLNI